MILLSSSLPKGLAYIETKSLDGETNLKNRNGLPICLGMSEKEMASFEGVIKSEQPQEQIYEFKSKIIDKNGTEHQIEADKQLLLRGSQLRNTEWALGVVVATGLDTKLMLNSKRPPHKISKLERTTNYMILLLVLFICIITIICSAGLAIFNSVYQDSQNLPFMWYYFWGPRPSSYKSQTTTLFFEGLVTFFILFNNFIPISLYVSMEITKVWQAVVWIKYDPGMVYLVEDGEPKNAYAKTASLVEELGQVEYIFSDKTGTLTQNKMEFLKFCVNGQNYGKGTTEIGRAAALRRGETLEDDKPSDWKPDSSGFQFYDPRITGNNFRKDKNAKEIEEFIMFLAVCHTVIPEIKKKKGSEETEIFYNASSPDEGALVKAAKYLGYEFKSRSHDEITYINPDGKEVSIKILNVFEFNSTRKRMSVIVKNEKNEYVLYCKGADSVLWKLMKKDCLYKDKTIKELEQFGADGLRTLLCAKRPLTFDEWNDWNEKYWKPATFDLTTEKDKKIAIASEIMEKELELVGATAIEDKLQDGVPETISTLLKAGCKIWVLTGDKQETAINIGFACAMLDNNMHKIVVNEKNKKTLKKYLIDQYEDLVVKSRESKNQDFAVIVDGDTLDLILNWDKESKPKEIEEGVPLRMIFLKLCLFCKSVICCRVSPLQKAQVVLLVKNNLENVITLAIGDGANDVSMIQAAHIGVGISGEEGEQATRASDFAIAQFKFLKRLLLVHGRYAYRRVSKLILYFFYKNAALQFTQLFYVFYNAFTGTSLYDSTILSLYNVFWTSLPIFGLSFFDKEVSPEISLEFPELYILGQKSYYFNITNFCLWFLNSFYHSAICFFVLEYLLQYGLLTNGRTPSARMVGSLLMAAVILVVMFKVGLETIDWNPVFFCLILITIGIYPAFLACYHGLGQVIQNTSVSQSIQQQIIPVTDEMFEFMATGLPWLVLIIVILLALLKDICWKGLYRTFNTQLYHVLQETRSDKATRDFISSVYNIEQIKAPKRKIKYSGCCGIGAVKHDKSEVEELVPKVESEKNLQTIKIEIPVEDKDEKLTGYAFDELEGGKVKVLDMATSDKK